MPPFQQRFLDSDDNTNKPDMGIRSQSSVKITKALVWIDQLHSLTLWYSCPRSPLNVRSLKCSWDDSRKQNHGHQKWWILETYTSNSPVLYTWQMPWVFPSTLLQWTWVQFSHLFLFILLVRHWKRTKITVESTLVSLYPQVSQSC